MRTLVIILIALFAAPSISHAHLKKVKELHQQHKHDKKMKHAAHAACKEQNGGHQILHHHKK